MAAIPSGCETQRFLSAASPRAGNTEPGRRTNRDCLSVGNSVIAESHVRLRSPVFSLRWTDFRIVLQVAASDVWKRNDFTEYRDEARAVLQALLDKSADEGIDDMESMEVLKMQPLSSFGTPLEIVRMFGSKQDYLRALKDLEAEVG